MVGTLSSLFTTELSAINIQELVRKEKEQHSLLNSIYLKWDGFFVCYRNSGMFQTSPHKVALTKSTWKPESDRYQVLLVQEIHSDRETPTATLRRPWGVTRPVELQPQTTPQDDRPRVSQPVERARAFGKRWVLLEHCKYITLICMNIPLARTLSLASHPGGNEYCKGMPRIMCR